MTWRWCVFLCVLTALAYAPVSRAGFVYEDTHWRTAAPLSRTVVLSHDDVPDLAMQSLAWNAQASDGAAVFHLTNVALHLLNGLLVWAVLGTWVAPLAALAGTGLFLLHPLQSEAVAYVAGRTELVSAGLVLVAVWLTRRSLTTPRVLAAAVCLLLAVTAKASAVVGLALVPWTWRYGGRTTTARGVAWLKAVGTILVVLGVARAATIVADPYLAASPHGMLGYAALQATAVWHYAGLLVVPVGLSVDHDFELVTHGWALLALAGIAVLGGVALQTRRALVGLGLAWLLIALAPRFVLRMPELLREHTLYLPMVGVAILVAAAVNRGTHGLQ